MGIKVITPPSAVLTLEQLRRHCKIEPPDAVNDADIDLSSALAAAHKTAQHHTGLSIGSQTLELALDEFPAAGILLPQGPVTSISSVTYVDANAVTQTLSSALYSLDDYGTPQWLLPAYSTSWPETLAVANAVKVQYVAGAATIDGAVAQALRLLVGLYYAARNAADQGQIMEIPFGVQTLLDTTKDWSGQA